MERLSRTCFSVRGDALLAFDTEQEARWAADYQNHCHGRSFEGYACERCGLWHLAPKGSRAGSAKCLFCAGSDGAAKSSYPSVEAAERQAQRTRRETGVALMVYRCPVGNGFHLTQKR